MNRLAPRRLPPIAALWIRADTPKRLTCIPTTSGSGMITRATIRAFIWTALLNMDALPGASDEITFFAWRAAVPFWIRRILLQRGFVRLRLLQRLAVGQRSDRHIRRPGSRRLLSGLQRETGDLRSRAVPGKLIRALT